VAGHHCRFYFLPFVLLGALRGTFATATGLVALILSYVSAFMLGSALGSTVADRLELALIVGVAIAGGVAFLITHLVVIVVAGRVRRMLALRHEPDERPQRHWLDRVGGAACGALRGGLILMLIGWVMIWLGAGRDLGVERLANVPDTADAQLTKLTQKVVKGVVLAAMSGEGATVTFAARVATDPTPTLRSIRQFLDDPRIVAWGKDTRFWNEVENGDVDAAFESTTFLRAIRYKPLREHMATLGLISPEAVNDSRIFRDELTRVLRQVGPKIRQVRRAPELQQLAQDEALVEHLRNGDTMKIVTDPAVQHLVSRIVYGR